MGERLRMAELCAGYGGAFMASRAAGWDVELAWYAENDDDASTVLAAHHPGAPNIGDITVAQFSACEPVDVLAAGWPCTPISGAGKQLGSADERWLWPDVARAVRTLAPPVFLGENVPRLLTIEDGRLFGGVLADLDDLGYTVRWTTVGACRVGLCHHRHRVFIAATREPVELDRWALARRCDDGWEVAADTLLGVRGLAPVWPLAGVVSGGLAWEMPAEPCGESGVVLLPTPRAGEGWTAGRRATESWRPSLVEALLPTPTARDGLSGPGHAATAEGTPDLRTVAAFLPTPRARDGKGRDPNPRGIDLNEAIGQLLPTPTAVDAKGARNATAGRSPGALFSAGWTLSDIAYADRWGRYGAAIRRHEAVTGVPAPEPTEPNTQGGRRLAAALPEWMQGLPPGHITDHVGRNPALRIAGNGIAIPAAAYAWSLLLPHGVRREPAEVSRA